jgi:hypothetical protein
MKLDTTSWRRLTPDVIAEVPEAAAVFEVANLVRTVLYIGAADGNLRARLASISLEQTKLPLSTGGYYFRYEAVTHESEQLAARLAAYRESHGGQLPAGNRGAPRPLRLASRSAA